MLLPNIIFFPVEMCVAVDSGQIRKGVAIICLLINIFIISILLYNNIQITKSTRNIPRTRHGESHQ